MLVDELHGIHACTFEALEDKTYLSRTDKVSDSISASFLHVKILGDLSPEMKEKIKAAGTKSALTIAEKINQISD